MARKRYTTEQIIGMLREAEVMLSQGETVGAILGISEHSYYRWRQCPISHDRSVPVFDGVEHRNHIAAPEGID